MTKLNHIFRLIPFVFMLIALIPAIGIELRLFLFIVVLSYILSKVFIDKVKVASLIIIIFSIYLSLTWIIGFSQSPYGRLFNFLGYFLSLVFCLETKVINSNVEKLITSTTYVVILMLCAQIYILIRDPLILYKANYLDSKDIPMLMGNTIYVMFLCLLSYFICFFCNISKFKKSMIFALTLVYVTLSGKTTSLILISLLIFMTFCIRGKFIFKITSTVVFVSILFALYRLSILPDFVIERVDTVANLFITNDSNSGSEYLERFNLLKLSLSTFMENPIFGVGGNYVNFQGDFDLVYSSGIGHHSELIDFFARFGIVGIIVIIFSHGVVFYKHLTNNLTFLLFFSIVISWFVLNNGFSFEFAFLNIFAYLVLEKNKKFN